MPFAPKHPCASSGCRALVQRGKARCDDHERQNDRRRGTAHERGYDARWRKYRLAYLREHPLCVECESEGITEPATVVDHIQAHKGDERLFWEPSNHRAICRVHHDARVDEGDFGR